MFFTAYNRFRCRIPAWKSGREAQSTGYIALHPQHNANQLVVIFIVAVLSAVSGGLLVFSLNPCSIKPDCRMEGYSNSNVPVRIIQSNFVYNRSFGASPVEDERSDALWESLIPLGRGTVQYPAKSHEFYTVSAVHQLHCLWTLRNVVHSTPHGNDAHAHESQHVRHCLDYLRQILLCAADTTLEPVEPELGGVTGWNVQRSCRSYSDLQTWAEERRASNAVGFGVD